MRSTSSTALCATLLFALLAACASSKSGGSSSTTTGCPKQCPNDPPYSSTDVSDCNANVSDPACGAQAQALYTCIDAKVTCDASGQTDGNALLAACGSYKGAWEACQTADAGAD
jgi:hypothetical protein